MSHTGLAAFAVAAAAVVMAGARPVGSTYDTRPPVAHTGGFGEPTCHACHMDGPAPVATGLSLGGLPAAYRPGQRYTLTVAVSSPAMQLAGFQLASRVARGPRGGAQAGTLSRLDARVTIATDSLRRVQYVSHARALPADSARWRFRWTAPSRNVGPVSFHVTANAANDDDSALGDVILADSAVIPPWRPGSAARQTPR